MINRIFLTFLLSFILSIISFVPSSIAQYKEWRSNVITDPSISARCKHLARKRDKKVKIKQKLMGLLNRNKRLRKITPKKKYYLKKKLITLNSELRHELDLIRFKIESIEENIIRKGCPALII